MEEALDIEDSMHFFFKKKNCAEHEFSDTMKPEEWLKKRSGAAMKAAQKFPEMKAIQQ